jgi:hypothetical protein
VAKAKLDGVLFRTEPSQMKMKSDNSCLMEETMLQGEGKENPEKSRLYGRIQRMFVHRMHPGETSPEMVVVECDWYHATGTNQVNGLIQLERNHHFDSCRVKFLKDCVARNFVFWPSVMDEVPCTKWDLIEHHEN